MIKRNGRLKCRGINSERELVSAFRRFYNKARGIKEFRQSCAIEFKFVKGNRLNLKNHFRPQQLPSLYEAKHHCLYDKISDMSAGLKPFDSFIICGNAYAAVMFSGDNDLFFIDIDSLYPIKKPSFTRDDVLKVAIFSVTLAK